MPLVVEDFSGVPENKIVCGDCRRVMRKLPSECIDLVVTSPPYNVGMEYEEPLTEDEYTEFLKDVLVGIKRVLKPDGRICWNVPYQMISARRQIFSPYYCSMVAIKEAGLKYRDNITWNKIKCANDTAWGSWCSASAPWIRHMSEAIIIAYKEEWKKRKMGTSDITKEEFLKYTLDIWSIPCAKRSVIKHPAPFPEQLAERCIKLFSYVGDTVLDPFLGSGTTMVSAIRLRRKAIGIEVRKDYCELAKRRLINSLPELCHRSLPV